MIPMNTRLVYKYKNEDKRELSFEEWILYIIEQEVNQKTLPWNRKIVEIWNKKL